MKEGWKYSTLGECCDINYGTRVVRKNVSGDKYPVYGGGGETFRMDDYNREDCLIVSRFAMSKLCTRLVKGKFFLNDSGLSLSPKDGSGLTKDLLERFILASNDTIYSYGRGSAQRNLNIKEFSKMPVSYPASLSDQERIVSYLDSAFAKIDQLKSNAEKQMEEAKALFASALQSEMEPKEGWEEKTLKEIGQTQTGSTPSKAVKENYGDYIPFIRPAELNIDGNGGIEYNSEVKLSKEGLSRSRLIKENSILMCCIGSVGKTGYSLMDVTCNQQINTLTPIESYDAKYVYYALTSSQFQSEVKKIADGAKATLPIINKGKWEQLIIFAPSLPEQQRIVAHLDELSAKTRQLEENYKTICAECDAMKQAILRETFE